MALLQHLHEGTFFSPYCSQCERNRDRKTEWTLLLVIHPPEEVACVIFTCTLVFSSVTIVKYSIYSLFQLSHISHLEAHKHCKKGHF